MKSDPGCHEREEEALKAPCVFGKLTVLPESNERMSSALERHGGKQDSLDGRKSSGHEGPFLPI